MKHRVHCLLAILLILQLFLSTATAASPSRGSGDMPKALYSGITTSSVFIRVERSKEADTVGHYTSGSKVMIIDYDPEWVTVVSGTERDWVTGYVLRHLITDIKQLEGTRLPFGATPARYVGRIARDTALYTEPNEDSEPFFTLTEGTPVAIIGLENGWAKVIYWRLYGYFYMGDVVDLYPVYDAELAKSGDMISAFMSFYNLKEDEMNLNRMENIRLACEYISIELEPGMEFSFDHIAGPYRGDRGYLEGLSYFEGETVPSSGGGVCQVSSTLYNVLLGLPEGIEVVYRRAHGPSGATYLPHGVDAAVGNETLNLVFRNNYSFSIQLEATPQDGVLYIAFRKI